MSIVCRNITDYIEDFAPKNLAEDWDNVGLLVGSMAREVNRVMLCLDVTPEVLNEAVERKAELVLSHHPVIFKGIRRILEDEPAGWLLEKLLRHGICVYSAHTNLDVTRGGVNDVLAHKLKLKSIVNLKDYGSPDKTGFQYGLGKVGYVEEKLQLDGFVKLVKSALEVDSVRVIGNMAASIQKVAVFCGSFDSDLEPLKRHEAEVLVTGDVKYHTAVDVLQMGKCVIDAGHFNTEKLVLPVLADQLSKRFSNIEVFCSKVEKDPFSTY